MSATDKLQGRSLNIHDNLPEQLRGALKTLDAPSPRATLVDDITAAADRQGHRRVSRTAGIGVAAAAAVALGGGAIIASQANRAQPVQAAASTTTTLRQRSSARAPAGSAV